MFLSLPFCFYPLPGPDSCCRCGPLHWFSRCWPSLLFSPIHSTPCCQTIPCRKALLSFLLDTSNDSLSPVGESALQTATSEPNWPGASPRFALHGQATLALLSTCVSMAMRPRVLTTAIEFKIQVRRRAWLGKSLQYLPPLPLSHPSAVPSPKGHKVEANCTSTKGILGDRYWSLRVSHKHGAKGVEDKIKRRALRLGIATSGLKFQRKKEVTLASELSMGTLRRWRPHPAVSILVPDA